MNANVLRGISKFGTEDLVKERAEVGEAIVRVTLTTICGTDLHTVRGEYPVKPGLVIGHERSGSSKNLVMVRCWRSGAGWGHHALRSTSGVALGVRVGMRPWRRLPGARRLAPWKHDDGARAEYVKIPDAQANLAKIPRWAR